MAPNRVNLGYPAEVIAGVGVSRTLPPVLPPNFLSRKHILEKLAIDRSGRTLISAPAGFGKTTLVAEYLSLCNYPVIWYTSSERDGATELHAHLLQAIRNVVPDFASWFTGIEELKSPETLAKIFKELGAKGGHYILVIDSNRTSQSTTEVISNKVLDLLPINVHAIVIQRVAPGTDYSNFINHPNYNILA